MPFHIFLSQSLSTVTGGLDVWKIAKDIVTAGLATLCVLLVIWRKKYTKPYLIILGAAVGYLLLHLVLVVVTNQPMRTGLLGTIYNNRLLWYLLIAYSAALLVGNHLAEKRVIKLVLTVSTVVCLIALLQWILPKDIMTHFGYAVERGVKPNFFIDDKADLPRVFSTLRDPNSLGAFLVVPITLLLHSWLKFWRSNKRMLLSGLLLLHGLILFLTFSRSAWLAMVFSLGALLLLTQGKLITKHLKKFAPVIVVGLVLIIGGLFILRDQYIVQNVLLHSDENTTAQQDSNDLHLRLIQSGLSGIVNDPQGHGPGSAGIVSIQNSQGVFLTENYYLQIGYEVGLPGLLCFLAIIFYATNRLIHTFREKNSPILPAVLLSSMAGYVVMAMLTHLWTNEAVACQWWMLAGILLGLGTKSKQRKLWPKQR